MNKLNIPVTREAYRLLHDGAIALSVVESNGMRIDVGYLDRVISEVGDRIAGMAEELRNDEVYSLWRRKYGSRLNLGSREQLGRILFEEMGLECGKRTKTGRPVVDEEALGRLDVPFVTKYLRVEKMKKLRRTYLKGVRREVVDGLLHAVFNLHLAVTFRSSSDSPNFQNIPARDPEISSLIRRAFIPRRGHSLVEIDYKAIEVRVAACYHHDPTMVQYIEDDYDLHRDMGAQCYCLTLDQVTKPVRHMGKNGFVFPSFYGDYYRTICQNLWRAIDRDNLQTQDGTPLKEHLRTQGIKELGCDSKSPRKGTFEHHIKQVEDHFWGERFPQYSQWKDEWWKQYLRQGWYQMHTGFISRGVYKRNEVINGPIQGSAFHCLLWSLIRLTKWLRKERMRSLIVGQIHDSVLLDVAGDEFEDVVEMARMIMTDSIRQVWKWITVPLEVEVEASEKNWFEKREVELVRV